MRLFLIDHSYGACLAYAHDKAEAEMMGDALGDVLGVYPFDVPMVFSIERPPHDPSATGESDDGPALKIDADATWEFEDDVQKVLTRHRVALSGEEHRAMKAARERAKQARDRRGTEKTE